MSSMSSASANFSIPVSEKLNRGNFLVWRAQVLPAVRGARLVGFLDGSSVEPAPMITVNKPDNTEEDCTYESRLCAMDCTRSTSIVLPSVVHDKGDSSSGLLSRACFRSLEICFIDVFISSQVTYSSDQISAL